MTKLSSKNTQTNIDAWIASSLFKFFRYAAQIKQLLAMTACMSILLFFSAPILHAQTREVYVFNAAEQQTEFNDVLKNLRCLVCQNQDLHDSQTQFAEGLRQQIHQWILEGKSQKEIVNILTSQYGDTISFQPPLKSNTYILWIVPFALFFLFIFFMIVTIYRRRTPPL